MRKDNWLNALFPETRQRILATLLPQPERRWYLTELAQHLQVRPSSLQRELAALTDAGILRREPDGVRTYFQANRDFPLLPELQSLFRKTVGLAEAVSAALKPFQDDIEFAFIFGSVARGESTGSSDLDLLLIGTVRLRDLSLTLRELEQTLKIPINPSVYTCEEFLGKWRDGNHFLHTLMQDRKIFVKGTDDELADTLSRWEGSISSDKSAGTGCTSGSH